MKKVVRKLKVSRPKSVYLVLHHEFMGTDARLHIDEMLFYTCSSLTKAIAQIKRSHVANYSWWEIQKQAIDSPDWPKHVGYFARNGAKLKKPPFTTALKKYQHWLTTPDKSSCLK